MNKCKSCFWFNNCGLVVKSPDCQYYVTKRELIDRGQFPNQEEDLHEQESNEGNTLVRRK